MLSGYLAGWLPIGAMLAFTLNVSSRLNAAEVVFLAAALTLVLAFVSLSAWYICRSLDLRSTADWKLALTFILAAMCGSTVVMLIANLLVWSLNHVDTGMEGRFHPAIPVLAGTFSLIYLLSIVLHYLILAIETSQRAEILSREAELKALKAQVNPHFLFNSLNSISALTSIDPAKARQMCIALSDFLRTSLRLGERPSIPFSEELALTDSYLSVEQVRFGKRLRVKQEFDSNCCDCTVPPLLVQPLVENAIKHGIATLAEGGEIAVRGQKLHDQLCVTIENPFDPEAPPAQQTGFGLLSVRNRIRARYGNAGKLEIEIEAAMYRVTLSLPWVSAEPR
ncbi:MAG: histidine kinase [Acidobacteriota bacterium]|nr:histidine kinase [Acidobacteriota bacterium]